MTREELAAMVLDADKSKLTISFNSFKYGITFMLRKLYRIVRSPYDFKRIHWVYLNKKASEQLGYEPKVSLKSGFEFMMNQMHQGIG